MNSDLGPHAEYQRQTLLIEGRCSVAERYAIKRVRRVIAWRRVASNRGSGRATGAIKRAAGLRRTRSHSERDVDVCLIHIRRGSPAHLPVHTYRTSHMLVVVLRVLYDRVL